MAEAGQMEELAGRDLGYTAWLRIDQGRVNQFADVTIDHQYIHVDEEKASATPFGGTIAHGFLTLSLLSHFASEFAQPPPNTMMGINYGFDKVRFLAPVPVGSEVRAHATVASVVRRKPDQILTTYDMKIEIRGTETPALVAQWLVLSITA